MYIFQYSNKFCTVLIGNVKTSYFIVDRDEDNLSVMICFNTEFLRS